MRFKFSIRELFLVVCIVGVALGWWSDRQRTAHYREKVSLVLQHSLKVPASNIPVTINDYYDELVQRGFKGIADEEELPFASASQPATE